MVKWQTVAKLISGGSIGIVGLFTYLFLLTGIEYTYTGDSVCDKLNCEAYINISSSYWRICFDYYEGTKYEDQDILFKKRSRSRTLHVDLDRVDMIISTDPKIPVEWLVPARGKGNWRPIKGGDCWNRLKTNKIKLVGHPTEAQVIKWSFEIGDEVTIDPIFISWDYTYENLSKVVQDYKEDLVIVKEKCFTNLTTSSIQCVPAYNYTKNTLIGYKTEYYQKTGDKILDRIGVKVGNKEHLGWYDVCDNFLVEYKFNPGDRSKEYCRCRGFELQKNSCEETKLI